MARVEHVLELPEYAQALLAAALGVDKDNEGNGVGRWLHLQRAVHGRHGDRGVLAGESALSVKDAGADARRGYDVLLQLSQVAYGCLRLATLRMQLQQRGG